MNNRAPFKPVPAPRDESARTARTVEVSIRPGHVRRAVRLAETVQEEARSASDGRIEDGVVLMTAMLLVERLADSSGCEPIAVLRHMADCFELKQVYTKTRSGFLT